MGKKICKFKKLTLYKETKQNYNNHKKNKLKGENRRENEKELTTGIELGNFSRGGQFRYLGRAGQLR